MSRRWVDDSFAKRIDAAEVAASTQPMDPVLRAQIREVERARYAREKVERTAQDRTAELMRRLMEYGKRHEHRLPESLEVLKKETPSLDVAGYDYYGASLPDRWRWKPYAGDALVVLIGKERLNGGEVAMGLMTGSGVVGVVATPAKVRMYLAGDVRARRALRLPAGASGERAGVDG